MKASWVVSSQSPFVPITKPPGNLAGPGAAAWERSRIGIGEGLRVTGKVNWKICEGRFVWHLLRKNDSHHLPSVLKLF